MPSIKVLKDKFDSLPFTEDNILLYNALLDLDISDFKPIMEEILLGRIDIEDTRKLFNNTMQPTWAARYPKDNLQDSRLSADIISTMKQNLANRISGDPNAIIKENLTFPSTVDLKHKIAAQFLEEHGVQLSSEEIDKILPIVEAELYAELSMANGSTVKNKETQLYLANQLAYKPITEI